MIKSLLVANRGEIACRIMRTAQKLGIETVAVYSDADADALHVRLADQAVHIGPSAAAESYLIGEKIIAAAKESGADAIHPGYGFLSENADFAQKVIDAGLIWVGPQPDSIRAMGLKDAAKKLMDQAGVPTTPGYLGDDQSDDMLAAKAKEIGYPVLIKAVAGGGGKGMRKVDDPAKFQDDLASCRREASASFGNDVVLLEKWIDVPRHIEVQIFGDSHGNVVHLFERDCTLQRRHQKVIEEAPAPGMDEATRAQVCAAAVRAGEAVHYQGAGTIEFIADASEGLRADRIWFMEMNTRLQVEHPVTEEITGVDLVEWQLRVASGEKIPLAQDRLTINGWAMEARLYAEDPISGFLPSTGPLDYFAMPRAARIETGVEEGDAVSPFYDPMIAKIIVHGKDREAAIDQLADACASAHIYPVKTNAGFLVRALESEGFRAATMTTGYIAEHQDALIPSADAPAALWREAAHMREYIDGSHDDLQESELRSPWRALMGFRANAPATSHVALAYGGEVRMIELFSADENGDDANASGNDEDANGRDTQQYDLAIVQDKILGFDRGRVFAFSLPGGGAAGAASNGAILSPMPGKIIAVDVAKGAAVAKGDRLVTLEAMKMEHSLVAPFDGVVKSLMAAAGDQVSDGVILVEIEANE